MSKTADPEKCSIIIAQRSAFFWKSREKRIQRRRVLLISIEPPPGNWFFSGDLE
jgi:hypothetical protein